jgi:hypothetical protein
MTFRELISFISKAYGAEGKAICNLSTLITPVADRDVTAARISRVISLTLCREVRVKTLISYRASIDKIILAAFKHGFISGDELKDLINQAYEEFNEVTTPITK